MEIGKIIKNSVTSISPIVVKSIGISFLCGLVWQHVGRKINAKIKPSNGLNVVVAESRYGFARIGEYYAILCGSLSCREIKLTLQELFIPLFKLLTSPIYLGIGYFDRVKVEDNKMRIYTYSLLVALLTGSCFKAHDIYSVLAQSVSRLPGLIKR
jgi:hypothetical protein